MSCSGKRGFVLSLIFTLIVLPIFLFSQLIITEVMSNVKGSDSSIGGTPGDRNEYIELYNNSDSIINIKYYTISDGDAIDQLDCWDDTYGILPDNVIINDSILYSHHFAVILDPEYCDSSYGNFDFFMPYIFGDSTLIIKPINTTIGNGLSTNDPIFLYDSNLVIIDTYGTPFDTTDTIPFDPGDGISMERVYFNSNDNINNWAPSTDQSGGTPGMYNSISNAKLFNIKFNYSISDKIVNIDYELHNLLNLNLENTSIVLKIYRIDTYFHSIKTTPLFSGTISDSIYLFTSLFNADIDAFYISQLIFQQDNIKFNDTKWISKGSNIVPPIVINEIMENGLISSDWIELHNVLDTSISIEDICLSVNNSNYNISLLNFYPDDFIVLIYDTSKFYNKYSRNVKVYKLRHALSLKSNDSLKLTVGSTDFEIIYIDRSLHFDNDISIERIKQNITGSNISNWGFSRDPNGATPGITNSIANKNSVEAKLKPAISPNPFVYNLHSYIEIKLPENSNIIKSINIYNVDGYRINTLDILSPYQKDFIWIPKNRNGNNLTTGLYIIVIQYINIDGKREKVKIPLAIKR